MAEPTGGGPSFGEVGDVEPNGSGERVDAVGKQRSVDRRAEPARLVRTEPGPPVGTPALRTSPMRLVIGVALGAVVLTLATVFLALRAFSPAAPTTSVAGVSVAAPPVATVAQPAAPIAPAAQPTSVARETTQPPPAAAVSAACTTSVGEAQTLGQARRWSDAAAKLESARGQCDVVGPLYDAYLNQARGLAEDERGAEAITLFD